jgi:N-acetylmuramoyl-L-alanine amidase
MMAFALLLALPTAAAAHRSEAWAQSQFSATQKLHTALEAQPAQELTRKDYERVIAAYKRVYLEAPTSTKADPSVMASAQLLEEMGRRFNDHTVLRSAIQQYEFLRRQYPGSKSRFSALFHIGEIYHDDLHDKANADEAFQEFLRRYPRNQFADEARKSLSEPVEKASVKTAVKKKAPALEEKAEDDDADDNPPAAVVATKDAPAAEESRASKAAHVTGIRYWSMPDSTRVAIDLERGVKFAAQRIDDPDRIFFDLLNTQLDPKLTGQTIDVGDGFLKTIRIAQFKPGRTRVVLEVDDVSNFKAALLDNPPRLVIDVLNTRTGATSTRKETVAKPTAAKPSSPGAAEVASDAKPDTARAEVADKPDSTRTVITSNGVKKTIVDADDESVALPVAKSDPAVIKPVISVPIKSAKKTVADADDTPATVPAKLEVAESKPAVNPSEAGTPADPPKKRGTKGKAKAVVPDDPITREAEPTEGGDRSLIRALGLKIGKIVVDPGHGGHDTGTIGPNGLQEKDLVLDVSRRLGKLLTTRLGAEVVYTRRDDTFIPLETRTAIANQEGSDLFISVHANSSRDPDARGVETYYLNFSSSPEALEVAARENAVSEKSIHELQDLVKKIALKEKIEESHEFATDVERSLHSGLVAKNPGLRDRGVKKAPFIVLIGANMPSILAEISFLSNPADERKLKTPEYRQRIAESLYRGIAKYVNGLSGVKVASKIEKEEGQ